jgi:hypothetical protein
VTNWRRLMATMGASPLAYTGTTGSQHLDDRLREIALRTLSLPRNGCLVLAADLIVHYCD